MSQTFLEWMGGPNCLSDLIRHNEAEAERSRRVAESAVPRNKKGKPKRAHPSRPEPTKEPSSFTSLRRSRFRLYGLTPERTQQLLAEQRNRCALCPREIPHEAACVVDHCHATGRVRGLLCGACNWKLGIFKDDSCHLERAAAYLRDKRDKRDQG